MQAWSFDVAVVPARLEPGGRRDVSRPRWSRVVVSAGGLVEACLVAAQLAGVRGMVVEVLYRE
jgi:hypothetical protein